MSFLGGHSIALPYCLSLDLSYLPTTPCMPVLPQIWLSWVTPQVIPGWWIHSHGSSHDPHLSPTYSPLLSSGTTFATPPLDILRGLKLMDCQGEMQKPFPSLSLHTDFSPGLPTSVTLTFQPPCVHIRHFEVILVPAPSFPCLIIRQIPLILPQKCLHIYLSSILVALGPAFFILCSYWCPEQFSHSVLGFPAGVRPLETNPGVAHPWLPIA